ncbi:MAG TPA: tetratricopeptide repeat protein [Verrucomicrobiae bacterium]|nr:tetratricopeptide repeat protein [Verrucomicrobiae bacterium]
MNDETMPRRKLFLSVALLWPIGLWLMGGSFLVIAPRASAQSFEETQQDFLRGHYDKVIETARKKVEDGDYGGDWRVLLVKALLTVGRYHEAHTNAVAALHEYYSATLEKHLLARETSLYENDTAAANRQLLEMRLLVERRSGRFDPEDIVPLGRVLLLLGVEPKLVLENCFRRAETMSPPQREGFLASGQLALDKHDYALAADAFRAGLKQFPDDPDMETGLAQAFEPSDREEMSGAIQAALAVNPHHVPSLLLLTDHLIDAEEYDQAEKKISIVLNVNPHNPEALAYRAVLAHLRNDSASEQKFREQALQFWKSNPRVDYIIGLKLAQKYRFAEGAAAQKRALAFDPTYLPAQRELAEDLLRLGQTDEGWKLVQQVHATDDYDVTTYNLITLHDQMVKYQTLTNADFIVHMTPLEAKLYGDSVLDLLGRAKATLCRKYGVELTQPTTVDIFPEQKDFAVRTFGLPGNPGYLGVCFGSVITANSPASQEPNPANWQDVLWHEFCHVVTLNATQNKMPRWLSEGISVYEERQAKPTWGARMDLANRAMILDGKLTPLGELSSAFLAPKNGRELQFAYYESSLVVEFLAQQYGFDALKAILQELRDGKEINEAITAHTAALGDITKQFAKFARVKAENLAPGVDVETPPPHKSETETAAWEESHPKNYFVRMDKAHKLMEEKKWSEAKPLLEALTNEYLGEHQSENPLWLLAATERHLNETNAEYATLQKFAERESDFADLELRLIELSQDRQDWPNAIKYSQRLLAINPLISAPYEALAKAGAATGANDVAIDANRKLLLLNPPDAAQVHFQLAQLLHERGGSEPEARRHVLQALEEAPRFRDAQRLLLQIEAVKEGSSL